MADTFMGGIDVNDPIRPSDENQALNTLAATEFGLNQIEADRQSRGDRSEDEIHSPLRKWLSGEWSLFEIKFVPPGESTVQTSHVFGPSLEEVAKRCRQECDGAKSLVSVARVDDFKKAGLLNRDIEYWLSSIRSHSQYLLAKAADLRLRIASAYSCLRDGVSM